MGKLKFYNSLDEKKATFNQSDTTYYKIDNAIQFNGWYTQMKNLVEIEGAYTNFFRGIHEARFKLYNSSQRYWILNNLMQLEGLSAPIPYINMIQMMVNKAKEVKLLQQVFQYYQLENEQTDFPLLSILQHYNAPTPLLDWTYDLDIALFFAIENVKKSEEENVIEDYISIYRLNKNAHNSFLKDNLNYISGNIFPSVSGLSHHLSFQKMLVYISDFEIQEDRKIKPLTTYYNLNILAQKGLFIFNPDEERPMEDFHMNNKDANVDARVYCYNISKDLTELIKYKIAQSQIDQTLLFPDLKKYSENILNNYLKEITAPANLGIKI